MVAGYWRNGAAVSNRAYFGVVVAMMDFEAMALELEEIAADRAKGAREAIAAALKEAYNQGLEEGADIAAREHDHYENGDAGYYAADKIRAKKIPT